MPTYDYRCEACGHELELFQNISEAPKRKCPACKKARLKRLIGGGAGFLFKGSGFYLTDYRSDSYKQAASADSKAGESKPDETKSSATKPADSGATPAKPPPAAKSPKAEKPAAENKKGK